MTFITGWLIECPDCKTKQQVKNFGGKKFENIKVGELPINRFHNCVKCDKTIYMVIDLQVVKTEIVESIEV